MIFAFGEDGLITVYDDEASVRRDWEGLDVESRAVVFYAADGTWLEPTFTKPNQRELFGFVLTSGEYRLVPSPTRPPEVDGIEVALSEAAGIEPNAHFDSLDAVRRHFAAQRGGRSDG
jgi:hypothetical protein